MDTFTLSWFIDSRNIQIYINSLHTDVCSFIPQETESPNRLKLDNDYFHYDFNIN
jgi:hypothetical protein